MSIEFNPVTVRIDTYDDAIKFLEENNWDLSVINAIPEDKQMEFLKLDHINGRTVAHRMAIRGHEFTDPEILRLTDKENNTVAHMMSIMGHRLTSPEVLKLADDDGWTVAHIMATRGYEFTDPEILKLADNSGRTVADICDREHNTNKFNKILQEAEEEENRPGMG